MAIITFGPNIVEARGAIDGTVYSRGTWGPYMRARVSPVQPGTPAQSQIGAYFGSATQAWGQLQEDWRKTWDHLAHQLTRTNSLGHRYNLTGQTLYISTQVYRQLTGLSIDLTTAPPFPEPEPSWGHLLADVDLTAETITIDFTSWHTAGGYYLLNATGKLSPGTTYIKRSWLKQIRYELNDVDPPPLDVTADWVAIFGPVGALAAGDKVAFMVQFLDPNHLRLQRLKVTAIAHT